MGEGRFVPQAGSGARARIAAPGPFQVMVKPRGPVCNLDCTYCYYLAKEDLYPDGTRFQVTEDVLETFTREYLRAHEGEEVVFSWQGGEPTLLGTGFFRTALELQRRHARPGVSVRNVLQTNGTLVDEEWCDLFREHGFLVGLSMDGPPELHDANRVDKRGRPTSGRVQRALELFLSRDVEFNVLCTVHRGNARHPLDVYRFFRDEGVRFLQLIPVVEQADGGVGEHTVSPGDWGRFLCRLFDEWVRHDVGSVFVQLFDVALEAWVGMEPSLCVHASTCGAGLVMEHNGDVFSCDHYVTPDHFLGNVGDVPLGALAASPFQRRFGAAKRDSLPRTCRECPVLFACHGGCPKDRFALTPDGEEGLNYLCAGYRAFFMHAAPHMEAMAALLEAGRPPAAIMETFRTGRRPDGATPGRNDACPCGSGRKYKACCMG